MNRNSLLGFLSIIISASLLGGCTVVQAFFPTETPTATPTSTVTPEPPTPTPTPTEIPYFLDATVFSGQLQVPILIYHQFIPARLGPTTPMKMQLSEFEDELQSFYDNGFSLVSLESWVDGTFVVPPGRKPLIITIDDAWFGNQLFIDENGQPSEYSGLGILYQFSQEHPDFGFHAALFAINGDKYYAVKRVGDQFFGADNAVWATPLWRIKLGNTIAWALEHGLEVYNHTLFHPDLTNKSDSEIQKELRQNDIVLRQFLSEAERQDLIPMLNNAIALPEGKWPASQSGKNLILNYKNPEEKPVFAVLEAYNLDAVQFTPSFYSEGFNAFAIPRITASPYFVNYIIENKDLIPTAETCRLGPLQEEQSGDQAVLQTLIINSVESLACQQGVYHVNGYIFVARNGEVKLQLSPVTTSIPDQATLSPVQ